MKQNTFYVLVGIIALIEVGLFWWSVETRNPLLIQGAFVIGILALYGAKRTVKDVVEDERATLITQKSALRTLEVFWVIFFAVSLGSAVIGFSRPLGLSRPPPPFPAEVDLPSGIDLPHIGFFGIGQMALLSLIIFLYVGFRLYYARQYGGWEKDEE